MKTILKKLAGAVNPKKAVALLTAITFVATSVVGQGYSALVPGTIPVINSVALTGIENKVIPFNVGKITDALYSGKGSSVVINIQDLHSHEETQRNISTILEILDKKYGLERVYVEGAYGQVNTRWLSSIKDKKIKNEILNNMLESGRLTGSEYYAVESGRDEVLSGIEDKKTYVDNLKRLKDIYDNKAEIESYIPHIKYVLDKKTEIYYSQSNRKLNKIINRNKEGKISSERYFSYLMQSAMKSGIDLRRYGGLVSFVKVLEKQRKIEAEKINEEINNLMQELKGKISYEQYRQLTSKIGDKATETEFYFELMKVSENSGLLSQNKYRNINIFLDYLILSQSINPIELTYEEKRLKRELHNRFAVNEFEREVYFLREYVDYMSGYLNNKLTADEYEYFVENMGRFKVLWKKYVDVDGIIEIERYMELFEKFYAENVERNRYFIKNVMGIMPEREKEGVRIKAEIDHQGRVLEEIGTKKDIKVVITGGFHTYGFTKLLEDEGISYIVVTPNVTESAVTAEQKYEDIFRQQSGVLNETLQKMFVSSLGKGAVLNSDVLNTVIKYNKQVALSILNEMISNISDKVTVSDIDRQEDGFIIKFKEDGKEETIKISDDQIAQSKQEKETVFTKDTIAMFEAFDGIQKGFRQIREENRGGETTGVNLEQIKSLADKVENPVIKKQLQEAIERLGKASETESVKKELERLAKYSSTKLTQEKINETISLMEQGKLKLRNENFDIIEKDSEGKEVVIGVVDRNIAHRLELYHRVSCMFAITPDGNIVNIRRAMHKSEPGQITPYGGHVSAGESYETTRERELVEELGFPEGWKLQGRFENLTTKDKQLPEIMNKKHETPLDNESMHISAYFLSDEEYTIVKSEIKKLEQLRQKMTPSQYNAYLEENAVENFDIQEFNIDSFMAVVNDTGKNETSYTFADGSKVDFVDTFPDFFKRILFSNQQDVKKFRDIISSKKSSKQEKASNISDVWKSIEALASKDYPELVAQTKIDIQRMIETDAFLSNDEKKLSSEEKIKLVEAKILKVLQQLEKYLSGDLSDLIPSSEEKTVGFGTAGNRGIIGKDFDFNNVALIAQAMANIINRDPNLPKAVFVGNDTRFLGKWFSIVMERVLTANGIQVYTTNEKIATPTIACYVKEIMPGKFAATLNVTASHNPKEYNGVKPNSGDGAPALPSFTKLIADEIKEIQDSLNGKSLKIAKKENSITVKDADIKHFEYVKERLNDLIGLKEGGSLESFKQRASRIGIVLEAKNTALMPVLRSLFNYYGFTNVIVLNETRDVAFGGKVNPEPNDKNTLELESMVKKGKSLFKEKGMDVDFSFGISTDPDGDRFCVKDVNGTHMTPDEIGTIDAYELLENLINEMKAKRNAGQLTLAEIQKFQSIIVKSMVTTFALDSLAEVYSKEFMDIAFGKENKSVTEKDKTKYISDYEQGKYIPISVITTPVGWKNIADGQKEVEKSGKRFLIGVESSGGISIGLYDKDGAPATMMPVLFATKSGETLEQKLQKVEEKIGLKVHSIETAVKFPLVIEAEIEKNTKDIIQVTVDENEIDDDDKISIISKISEVDVRKMAVLKFAKKELSKDEQWYETAKIADIIEELAGSRQKALLNWIAGTTPEEIQQLLHSLGMSQDLKVVNIIKLPNEGIQIQMADNNYKEGDNIETLLTFRASGTEPLVRVYAYTTNKKLTEALKDIGENIVRGAFKAELPVLTDTAEYKNVKTEIKKDKSSIKDKFASDASKPKGEKRGDLFSQKLDLGNGSSLIFDFSRSVMTDNLLKMFANLFTARKVKEKIEAMFRGDKINWTENRAVLHTALRNTSDEPVYVDGKDVMPKVREVLQKMKDFSNKIITGQWKGSTGKQITDIVSIGIGGSDLGPRMGTEALSEFKSEGAPRVHFVSNVDPNDINSVLNSLGLNPETTLFIIESKTFTTEETMTNATLAKQWMTDKLGSSPDVIKKHFVAVSTNKEKVSQFGIDTDNMFEFWDWVGGRYSVWSAVGLPMMCSVGYENFMEFLDGAHAMDVHFRTTPYEQNIPVIMAMLNMANSNFLDRKAYAILPYNRYLKLFTAHIQQVYMESLGKSVDSQGRKIKYQTGSEIYGTAGTDAQHSYLQEHHQGTDIIPVDFIGFAKTRLTDPAMQTSHKRLLANMLAQADAMAFGRTYEETVEKLVAEGMERKQAERTAKDQTFDGNRPSNILMFDELNPRTLGALTALYENMVATLGAIWDVNAFDQMGVELGKKNAKSTFKALEDGVTDALNSSTANFVDLISGKLEISGVWDSVKNSWWVKILSSVMNPKNTFEGQMRVRNLAVAIKEFPRTLNLEKFIQAHEQPENVRQQATGLLKVTQKSFLQSALIAWKGAVLGAFGIFLTAGTGGLFLVGAIAVTSVLFLTPFITASVTNIKLHYKYNNSVDSDKADLIEKVLLNNTQARNYIKERLFNDSSITKDMTKKERLNYYTSVNIADKKELAYFLIDNQILFDDLQDLISQKIDKVLYEIEEYVFSSTGMYDQNLSVSLEFSKNNQTIIRNFEVLKAWLMINVGLGEKEIKMLFADPAGVDVIRNLAVKQQIERAFSIVNNPDSEQTKQLISVNREAYLISRMFKKYPAVMNTAWRASYDYSANADSIFKEIRNIGKSKLETVKTNNNDYTSDANMQSLEKAVKKLYSLSEKDRKKILDSISAKYTGLDLRFVGTSERPDQLALRIGVFYAVHFDGQLYKNANEPDTVPVDSSDKLPQNVKEILGDLIEYSEESNKINKIQNIYTTDENIGLLAGGLKILNAMGRKDKERIMKFLSEKYPGLEFRITGDVAKPETLALRIGVFFAVHSDGQLYKNANEPDTIAIDASDKLPENIVRILEDIKLLAEANAFYETKFTELRKAVFAPVEMTALFKGLLDEGYDDLLNMGSKYDDAVAVLQDGFKKYEQYFKEDQQKDLKYYINLKTLIENSKIFQIENMKYIYGGHELIEDFERWIREQIGLGAIYDSVDSKGVWDKIGFKITKKGTDEKDWVVTFEDNFEDILRIQALNINANLARRDGYEKLEKGSNGMPTERLGRILEGILQNELGPTYAGQVYNTDAYVNFTSTMLKRRAFMQYLAFIAVIKTLGTATDAEKEAILYNPELREQEKTALEKALKDIKNYYEKSVKGKEEFNENTLETKRLSETAELIEALYKATNLGFNVLGSQQNKFRQPLLTVFSAAPGAGKGTLSDYIFSNDKGAKKQNGEENIYKRLYDSIKSQLFHTRRIRVHLFEKTGDTYNFIPAENINELSADGSVTDKEGNPVVIKVVKVNGQLQGAVIGSGALIPVRYFIKKNPTDDTPWDYYLLENERIQIEQWKKDNPGRDIKELTLTRLATGMGVLFASDKMTYMEGGLAWKLELEKVYPAINTIFINSYDSKTKELRASSDKILHSYVKTPEELRIANEILRKMRIDENKEIDLRDNEKLHKLLKALGKNETAATLLINSSLSPFVALIQSFIKNIQLASLALLYKDKTSYTIVADVNDNARIETANILAQKGIKVNLILSGESGLVKETKERLEQNGKLAYGLVEKKDNLTVYGAEKIDNMTDAEVIESIIISIKSSDKSEIKILDITSGYDDLLGKELINDMVVKPNATPNELFIEALKQKQGKQKEQVLQFASLAENVSAEQVDAYNALNIQNAKESGLTTINISVNDGMFVEKSEKLLEIIKSAHDNGLKVTFNYKADFKKQSFDNIIKNIMNMTEIFEKFAIDGINLDLSDFGELASTAYLLVALDNLQKRTKNLAVKMPSSILESEYTGIFNKNGIKRIVNYKDIRNITNRQNVIVEVTVDKDVNNVFDQKELMSIFVNNNISMVAFDSRIIEALAKSNEGFSFAGIKNVAELLNAIFNTTPEGQYLKGIVKGRNIVAGQTDIEGLYELLKDGTNIAEKIKKYLPQSERSKEYTEQQAKGILVGMLEQIEWNAVDGNKLVFKNKEHQDMFMEMLVKYRLFAGNSYQNKGQNLEEILNPLANNTKVQEVLKLVSSTTDSAYNTEFISINLLSSVMEDDISSEEKTVALEGLLTLLLGMSNEVKNIAVIETMSVKDISAILRAA